MICSFSIVEMPDEKIIGKVCSWSVFKLSGTYGPSTWYGSDDTKWFKSPDNLFRYCGGQGSTIWVGIK